MGFGGEGSDTLYGGEGDDHLSGDDAFPSVTGSEGNDFLSGEGGHDWLYGQGGKDRLFGGDDGDRLYGGAGLDTLTGGLGKDHIEGGSGADLFGYSTVGESQLTFMGAFVIDDVDLIADFVQAEDKIDLSAIDANSAFSGNQAFLFIANSERYSGDWSGVLWSRSAGGGTSALASIDSDAQAELRIELTGAYMLTADDFIL